MMVPMVKCSEYSVTGLLVTAQFFSGMISGGDLPLPAELSPKFPATIYALNNMVSMSTGFIAPLVAGEILEHGSNAITQWRIVSSNSQISSNLGVF